MIEAVRRVSKAELRDFEFRMRHRYPKFAVRNFAYASSREWHEVEDKPYYYPIIFMEPPLTEAREVLGLDIDSVDFLREAMNKSLQQQTPAASRPFTLVEGSPYGDMSRVTFS